MKLKIIIVIISLMVAYLIFAYWRFYYLLGNTPLFPPQTGNSFILSKNEELKSVRYLALGDSLSAGTGTSRLEQGLIYQITNNFSTNNHGVEVLNLSQPGAKTEDLINWQLKKGLEFKPDYVTLFIGVNDLHGLVTPKQFQRQYQFILEELVSNTTAKIIIINLPYLGSPTLVLFPYNILLDYQTKQFNGIIDQLCREYKLSCIDLYRPNMEIVNNFESFYSADNFHPSDKGYKLWSEIINANLN